MVTRHGLVAALVLAGNGMAVGTAAAQEELPFEEIWRTDGTPEGLQLSWVTNAVVDGDGVVWILDEHRARVSAWDWPSRAVPPTNPRVFDELGLQAPVAMAARSGGGMAVLDVIRRSILQVSKSGSLDAEVHLGDIQLLFPKDLLVLADDRFVVLGGAVGSRAGLRIFAASGEMLLHGLEAESVGDSRTTAMLAGGVGTVVDEKVLVSLAQRPGLYSFDPSSGQSVLLDSMRSLFPNQGSDFVARTERNGQVHFSFRWFFTRPTALIQLPSGQLLHVVTNQEADQAIWELRARNGTLIRTFSAAAGYRPLSYAGDGIFLAMHLDPQSRAQTLVGLRVPRRILE